MFLIKWKNEALGYKVLSSLSRFPSLAAAERQKKIWQKIFPANMYYIEPNKSEQEEICQP